MKKPTVAEQKAEFVRRVVAASNKIGKVPEKKARTLANQLWSFRKESQRLAEAMCNRELTKREERRDEQLDGIVKDIGEEMGLVAYRQGDPRGWTIRVEVGRELANCFDGITTGCG